MPAPPLRAGHRDAALAEFLEVTAVLIRRESELAFIDERLLLGREEVGSGGGGEGREHGPPPPKPEFGRRTKRRTDHLDCRRAWRKE
jgi:hypothetical protein